MKKETEKQIKDAILQLSKRVSELEDKIVYEQQIGKLSSPSQIEFQAIQNPDGTLTPVQRPREIIIS